MRELGTKQKSVMRILALVPGRHSVIKQILLALGCFSLFSLGYIYHDSFSPSIKASALVREDENQERGSKEEQHEDRLDVIAESSPYSEEVLDMSTGTDIERIYYINMAERDERRRFMEGWLSEQSIPYERVEAMTATHNRCAMLSPKQKKDPKKLKWCHAMQGLKKTNNHIMRNYNTTGGLTLVLEDDYMVKNANKMKWAIDTLVPRDWEIIRFDCTGYRPSTIPVTKSNGDVEVFRTAHSVPCDESEEKEISSNGRCWFCGGTHNMVYRHSSLKSLHKVWKDQKEGIDCALTSDEIKSYCVNGLDIGDFMEKQWETSSILY